MRTAAIVAICVTCLQTNPYIIVPETDVGVLTVWPTARSTALAGAMTGLANEADATYFNPAGLAFQTAAKADLSYGNWLPGLDQGMYYTNAAGGAPLRLPFLRGRNAYLAGDLTYMTLGKEDIVNERGDFLGRVNVWRGVAAACAAVSLSRTIAAGVGVKLLKSTHAPPDIWVWDLNTGLEVEPGADKTAVAVGIGVLCCPGSAVSIGVAVANLGPRIQHWSDYSSLYGGGLPRVARLGLCWTPVEKGDIRFRMMPELDKSLYRYFGTQRVQSPLVASLRMSGRTSGKRSASRRRHLTSCRSG